jgi:hypothetical protein
MENELFPQIFIKQLPFKAHKTSNTSKNAYHQILTPPSKKVIKYIAKGCSSTWNNRWVLQTAHIPIYYVAAKGSGVFRLPLLKLPEPEEGWRSVCISQVLCQFLFPLPGSRRGK